MGRSNQIKRSRISVERELEAQALLQCEEPGPHSESEESDLEVSDSKNESDLEFNHYSRRPFGGTLDDFR